MGYLTSYEVPQLSAEDLQASMIYTSPEGWESLTVAYNINRLTLYAIITSMENDLRSFLEDHLLALKNISDLMAKEAYERASARAGRASGDQIPIGNQSILYYLDFADPVAIITRNSSLLSNEDQAYFKTITTRFERLTSIRNRVMHGRPLNFDDFAIATELAKEFALKSRIWPELSHTLQRIERNPGFVLSLEAEFFNPYEKISHNLPTPDFDETGFLGRQTDHARIRNHLLGPYPVITIVGEGGVGKTALALKVAYDLLDDPQSPFECIVWTSSKTHKITHSDIVLIKNAIADSVGVFSAIASVLGARTNSNDWGEIIEYMCSFKILLIIDNLETVLDDRIRGFLQELPVGSKVLLTSRLAVGAYDFPYTLAPLQENEATHLMRAVAQARNLVAVSKAKQITLLEYCRQLKCNPGFIKWFVASVAAGERPENVLSPQRAQLFLEFCMSHIYEHFSGHTKTLLNTMLCASGRHSFAMLQYLSALNVVELEKSLQELISANFVRMNTSETGALYDIKELANLFLSNYKMPSKEAAELVQKKRNILMSSWEESAQATRKWPYNPNNIYIETAEHRVAAKYLTDVLSLIKLRRLDDARQVISNVKNLCRDYFELYRVEAWLNIESGMFSEARGCYDLAICLAPEYAPLRLWFAGFLVRYCSGELELALQHLEDGKARDPNAVEFDLEIARVQLYQGKYEDVEYTVNSLLCNSDMSEWNRRKLYNLLFQRHKRMAEIYVEQKEHIKGCLALRALREAYLACPKPFLDFRNQAIIPSCIQAVRQLRCILTNATLAEFDHDFNFFLEHSGGASDSKGTHLTEGRQRGKIDRMIDGKAFGFIVMDDGARYFFHRGSLIDPRAWEKLIVGTIVEFALGFNDKGPCAVNVELVSTP